MKNALSFIGTTLFIVGYIGSIIVYIFSVWDMFHNDVGAGFFAVFFPIIGQIIWLFITGFTTPYAFCVYCVIAVFLFGFGFTAIAESEK